jgi:hypothetical protein
MQGDKCKQCPHTNEQHALGIGRCTAPGCTCRGFMAWARRLMARLGWTC